MHLRGGGFLGLFAAWLLAEALRGHTFRSIPRPWWLFELVLKSCQGTHSAAGHACRSIPRPWWLYGLVLKCCQGTHSEHSADSTGMVAL